MGRVSHHAGEAITGLFRARNTPVKFIVLGSPDMFVGVCTRGGAAKHG